LVAVELVVFVAGLFGECDFVGVTSNGLGLFFLVYVEDLDFGFAFLVAFEFDDVGAIIVIENSARNVQFFLVESFSLRFLILKFLFLLLWQLRVNRLILRRSQISPLNLDNKIISPRFSILILSIFSLNHKHGVIANRIISQEAWSVGQSLVGFCV
jgi:hypothetical protein